MSGLSLPCTVGFSARGPVAPSSGCPPRPPRSCASHTRRQAQPLVALCPLCSPGSEPGEPEAGLPCPGRHTQRRQCAEGQSLIVTPLSWPLSAYLSVSPAPVLTSFPPPETLAGQGQLEATGVVRVGSGPSHGGEDGLEQLPEPRRLWLARRPSAPSWGWGRRTGGVCFSFLFQKLEITPPGGCAPPAAAGRPRRTDREWSGGGSRSCSGEAALGERPGGAWGLREPAQGLCEDPPSLGHKQARAGSPQDGWEPSVL